MQRKNLYLVLLLFVFGLPAANAQFGVRAGVNLANQTYDQDVDGKKMKIGFGVGVFYKIMVSDNFTVQPEVNYIQHGVKIETSDDFLGDFTASQTLGYLQIPVLAKYGFGDMDATNFYVQAGPYVGLGLGDTKTKVCFGDDCETVSLAYGDDSGVESLDFGLQLGAGVNINGNISVDARYILGLQDINQDEDSSVKNNGIFVSVGYSF